MNPVNKIRLLLFAMGDFVQKMTFLFHPYVKTLQRTDSMHTDLIFPEMEKAKEVLKNQQ